MSSKQRRGSVSVAVNTHPHSSESRVTREELELLREKTIQLIQDNPEKAAVILSNWLKSEQTTSKNKYNKKAA